LLRRPENPTTFLLPKHCDKGAFQIKRPYISNLGWVGFGVGFEKIYRAIWFNVNAIIPEAKYVVKRIFSPSFFLIKANDIELLRTHGVSEY